MAKSIFVFVPAFGQIVQAQTFLTVLNLNNALAQKGVAGGVSCLSYPDIAELRNIALTIWYDALKQHSHILFVDADMAFDPQLVLDMVMFDEPVVGAMYPRRTLPLQWAASGLPEAEVERRAGFMKVSGLGMGCALIERAAIEIMIHQMPELEDKNIEMHSARSIFDGAGIKRIIKAFTKTTHHETGEELAEDLSFCQRWRDCGGSVWGAIAHKVQHIGPYVYEACYLEEAIKKDKEIEAKKAAETQIAAE